MKAIKYFAILLAALCFSKGTSAQAGIISQNGIGLVYSDATGQILSIVLSGQGDAMALSTPEIPASENPLHLTWHTCSAASARSLCIYAVVKNVSGRELQSGEVFFPDLRGMRPLVSSDFSAEDTELHMATGTINPFFGSSFSREYAGGMYQPFSLRFVDYGHLQAGFSIYEQEWGIDEITVAGAPRPSLLVERDDNVDRQGVRVAWKRHFSLSTGGEFVSRPFILTAERGGWAKRIEPYRAYVQSILNPSPNTPQVGSPYKRLHPVPQHVKDGIGYQTIWMVEGYETEHMPRRNFSFTDITSLADEAQQHGIDELVLYGAVRYGYVPIVHERKAGTIDELEAGVADARSMGVNVSVFFNAGTARNASLDWTKYFDAPNFTIPMNSDFRFQPDYWTFHSEFIPTMGVSRMKAKDFPVQLRSMESTKVSLEVLKDLKAGLIGSNWAGRGITSFSMDESNDDFNPSEFYYAINQIRSELAYANPSIAPTNTFSGEPFWGSLERSAIVLDYTWGWVDYLEAGPYLNAIKYPRLSANVSFSPRAVKMAFVDGLYINAMPSKANGANGSARLSSVPNVSKALRTSANLRHKFLPFFRDGFFLGESILARLPEPFRRRNKANHVGAATLELEKFEYPKSYIRAHASANGDRFLIIALNNHNNRRPLVYDVNAPVWMGASTLQNTQFKSYREDGVANGPCSVSFNSFDRTWRITTQPLDPLEMEICEIVR